MCIQAVEVYRKPGSAANTGGNVVPVPAPTNQPMEPTGARVGLLTGRRQWQDPARRSPEEDPDRDRLVRTQHPSVVSRSVAWCGTVAFRLSLALVALVRQAATIATSLHTRHRSVVSVLLHHQHHHHQRQHEGRRRRRPPRRQCQRKVNSAKETSALAPPAARDIATGEHPAGKRMHFLSPVDLTAKLVLLTLVLIAAVGHSEAGTCWLRRIESPGKCSQLFARNVTRESCCAAGSGAKGFSEKDITDVGLFFINAFNDGMECSSCLDTCDRAKCAANKRCVMRRNRPKCICAPTCSGGGRGPKRNNRAHRMQQVQQQQQQQHQLQPHFHQQNIKVINLSESQRNRRQYFADDGRQPRPRQLRYTGPEVAGAVDRDAHRRSVKKSSLSEPRSPQSSQRASAKHRAQDSDKERIDKKHNLLESVTLVSSSSGNSGNSRSSTSSSTSSSSSGSSGSSSSSSTSTSKATHRPHSRPRSPQPVPVNCTASDATPTAGCSPTTSPASSTASSAPETPGWTGGERMVLLQHGPANGLALNHHPGKGSGRVKGHPVATKTTPKPPTTAATGRHHRKALATNQTMMGAATHRNMSVAGREQSSAKPTVAPFAAFGKPKLLRLPKQGGGRHNGTVRGTVRVPRREPQYLDDVFFVDNYHHHRRNPQHRGATMDDFLGNEIMQHSNFYNPVCGTDGKTYKTECQLKKRACRQEITSLVVAYKGHCQIVVPIWDEKQYHCHQLHFPEPPMMERSKCLRASHSVRPITTSYMSVPSATFTPTRASCKFVKCPDGKRCIEDQNASPHCVSCGGAECRSDRSPKSVVCGTDGITYPSICELKRQACLTGRAIPLAYRGRCIEAATCETIKCKDRQHCLTDLKTHKPRCVSCTYKCPRMKRQQGHGKPFRNARNNPYGEQSVKLCGTNNRTYHSWCHMQKDSCNTGFYIDVQHSGSCGYGR